VTFFTTAEASSLIRITGGWSLGTIALQVASLTAVEADLLLTGAAWVWAVAGHVAALTTVVA